MSKEFAFEPALKELEAITAGFESGQTDLDQSLKQFERGLELVTSLKAHLEKIENQVERIKIAQTAKPAAADATDDPGLVTTDKLPF